MKKIAMLLCLLLLLTGCAKQTMETVDDVYGPQEPAKPAVLEISLPKDAAAQTIEGKTGTLYFCDNCDVAVETLTAGDLDATLRGLTGFGKDGLNVLEREKNGTKRYECTWSAVGESGDQIGRVLILDDGKYHYCITMTAAAKDGNATRETWENLISSVKLG